MNDRPEPKRIKTKDGWHITNGWINDIYFEVMQQPTEKGIKALDNLFLETAEMNARDMQIKKEEEETT